MPSEDEHFTAARRAKDIALLLLEQPEPSWAAVLVFYSALHNVNAYLARHGRHPQSHQERNGLVGLLTDLKAIYGSYRKLESRSMWARYDLRPMTSFDVEQLLTQDLAAIEEHIQGLLTK